MSTVWDKLRAKGAAAVYEHAETSGTVMLDTGGGGHNGTIDAGTQINQSGAELLGSRGPAWVLNAAEGGSVPGAAWMVPTVAGFTHVIFIRLTSITANAVMAARSDVNAANNKVNKLWSMQLSGSLGVITGRFFNVANTTAVTTSAAGVITTNTLIMLASSHGPSGNARIRKNGGNTVATAALNGTPAESSGIPLTHGRDSSLSVGAFNGKHYGGAYFLSELSDADLDEIWAWAQASLIDAVATVPATTAAMTLTFNDDAQMQAVVPATVAEFTLEVEDNTPEVTIGAVVPATTAAVSIDTDVHAQMLAVVPNPVATFDVPLFPEGPWSLAMHALGADVMWWSRLNDGESQWPDNDGAAVLWDASGNGHHGVYAGQWHQSEPLAGDGHSVTFDQGPLPGGGHADVPTTGWLDAANGPAEFSLGVWADESHSGGSTLFEAAGDFPLLITLDGNDLDVTLGMGGGSSRSLAESLIGVDGGRAFVVITFTDGVNGFKLYRNGVQRAVATITGGWTPDWGDDPLRMGSPSTPTDQPMDEAFIVGRVLSGAEVLALYIAGAVESISMLATVPKTTAAISAYPSPAIALGATVPKTTAAVALEVAPAVVMAAVVPATTASFTALINPEVAVAATVPATTAAVAITLLRDVEMQAVVPKTTAAVSVSLARTMTMQAVVPKTVALFEVAPEAQVTMQAVVPKTTAVVALAFPPSTDTTNRVGGRSRSGLGIATWEPPVVEIPPRYVTAYEGKREVAQAFTVPEMNGTMPVYVAELADVERQLDRIIVGGQDVTYFRDVPTPFPGYSLVEPLMYGPTAITFPQIAASFEQIGVGELRWLRTGAKVVIQRVDPVTLEVVATDYKGVVVGFDADGPSLTAQVGGEAQGRAALVNRQVPIWTSFQDIGRYAYSAMKDLGLRLTPYLGPETGIRLQRFGGQSVMDYISEILARSWNRQGNQWTIMPVADTDGVYEMHRKNTSTIHATAYADDTRVVASLHRDLAEEPNRIYMTGVSPGGQRIRFGVYPGLKQGPPAPYPYDDGRDFGVGTEDADTDTGDGITVMIGRLIVTKYLDQEDTPGGYDEQVVRAIRELQSDAGRDFVTGVMDEGTWRALYDLDTTGYSLRWSHIEPAAQRRRVRRWNRSASGGIMSRNKYYEPTALKVDANYDAGSGATRDTLTEWAEAELQTEDNWTGTINFPTGALVAGDHTPGDAIVDGDVFRARDLRPGHNISLPLFQGGITPHVAAITVGPDGVVSADVDTRARDAMKVWEVIARNRESRNNPARAWMRDHRSSTMTKDSMGVWDEVGGLLGDTITLEGGKWTVFPVVAGQEGTVRSLRFRTSPAAEFVCAVFGDTIYPTRLAALVGNPLTKAGSKRWADETVRDALDRTNLLLYVAGSNEEPCGYYPKQKHDEDDPETEGTDESIAVNTLTGRWEDDAGFSYHTGRNPVLYVAVFVDRNTTIPRGRVMWNQLEAGV